jgi:tetratricopeptide (TPR) repeat protein
MIVVLLQRNLKCLSLARKYAQLKEWAAARRYATAFLLERPNSAQALRLQGECDEFLQQKERALNEYRSSLAIDGTQRDLVFKGII